MTQLTSSQMTALPVPQIPGHLQPRQQGKWNRGKKRGNSLPLENKTKFSQKEINTLSQRVLELHNHLLSIYYITSFIFTSHFLILPPLIGKETEAQRSEGAYPRTHRRAESLTSQFGAKSSLCPATWFPETCS